ncbi:Crp/Fnr family transcriptional regulator [Streptomyces sp. NPDC058694]|uniref:Crp/Fnr family transcriptional regulator n=1 Tax=Streptomyces sp. NPDC058694 TaxID=3346603 RepID=UPI00366710A2
MQRHGFTEHFSPEDLLLLRSAGRVRAWDRNEILMREGDSPDFLVLIIGGLAKATVDSANGYTSLLALRGPGELVGELSCIDGCPRSATVIAMRSLEGVVVASDTFLQLLRDHAALSFSVLRSVVARLRDSDISRAEHGGRTSRALLARLLVNLALRHGTVAGTHPGAISVEVSQQELAAAAGVSRESVVRSMRAMHDEGLVATGRGRTVVLDLAGLRQWAET